MGTNDRPCLVCNSGRQRCSEILECYECYHERTSTATEAEPKDLEEFSVDEWVALVKEYQAALKTALEIHDEYMGQIGHCVSQDYARLNEFPLQCRGLGVTL